MKSLVYFLLNPLNLFWILLLAAGILRYFKRFRQAWMALCIAIVWMGVASVSPLSLWLIGGLEKGNAPVAISDSLKYPSVNVLILGGGHNIAEDLPATAQLSYTAISRLAEGLRMYKKMNVKKFICSGFSLSGRVSHAEMLANAAVELGIHPRDTVQHRTPADTYDEILAYKQKFGTQDPVIVVTSGYHMDRVKQICKKEGVPIVPAPCDFFFMKKEPGERLTDFKPGGQKIYMLQLAMHEYVGLFFERFLR